MGHPDSDHVSYAPGEAYGNELGARLPASVVHLGERPGFGEVAQKLASEEGIAVRRQIESCGQAP